MTVGICHRKTSEEGSSFFRRNMFPIEIYSQFVEVCGSGVMRVHPVRKWCRDFESNGVDICHDNRSIRSGTAFTDPNARPVEEVFLETETHRRSPVP